jgi:BMFP domain-containing protein YqiC
MLAIGRTDGADTMATENRIFEDLARVASGALGTLTGMRDEVEARAREQMERVLDRMNLVRREEFDAVQAMAAKARAAQEDLEVRVAALEARLAAAEHRAPGVRTPTRRNPRPRRPEHP